MANQAATEQIAEMKPDCYVPDGPRAQRGRSLVGTTMMHHPHPSLALIPSMLPTLYLNLLVARLTSHWLSQYRNHPCLVLFVAEPENQKLTGLVNELNIWKQNRI